MDWNGKTVGLGCGALAILGIIAVLIFGVFRTVNQGEECVITRFGQSVGVASPGLNTLTPFISDLHCFSTREVVYETSEQPDQSRADYRDFPVDAQTSDGQQVTVTYSVRFSADPTQIQSIYSDVAQDMGTVTERVIKFHSRSIVRETVQKYKADQLYTGNIVEVQSEIEGLLRAAAEKKHTLISAFVVRKITFAKEYTDSIEQQQIAFQGIQTAQYQAEQAKQNAVGAVNKAEGDAKVAVIQAQAAADSRVIQATGEAKANELITQSLNPTLIQYQYVNKLAPNVQTIFVPSGNQFILPLPTVGQ